MNHSNPNDQAHLDNATRHGESSDSETAELQDGWLTLGRLLDQEAARGFNADDLIAQLHVSEIAPAKQPLEQPAPVRRRSTVPSRYAYAMVFSGSAALLLAVLTLSWWIGGVQPAAVQIAGDEQRASVSADTSALAWDDDLDLQMQEASLSLAKARDGLAPLDASYSALRSRLLEFEQELENGSL